LLKQDDKIYCYELVEMPKYISFYINRFQERYNTSDVDIMKKIKFFNNCNSLQNCIKYKIHDIICYNQKDYYSVLNINQNKWLEFKENNIPSLTVISMNDDEIIEKIKKDVVFVIYALDN
jgi:hypothetical protein